MYLDDIKLAGKTENIEATWKILMEDVDLGEPTSFLDHVFWLVLGDLIFCGTGALERGELRSKGSGKKSMHFNGSTQNIELLLQMVISVDQLSIYGAVADMIDEIPVVQRAVGKPKAPSQPDKADILTQSLLEEVQANEERQGNLLQQYEQRSEKLSSEARFEISRNWTILPCSSVTKRRRNSIFMPRIHDASRSKGNSY